MLSGMSRIIFKLSVVYLSYGSAINSFEEGSEFTIFPLVECTISFAPTQEELSVQR